ncbi:hypothetical protein G4B88_002241, partial [Cannabis sativa]
MGPRSTRFFNQQHAILNILSNYRQKGYVSSDSKEGVAMSSKGETFSNTTDMDVGDDDFDNGEFMKPVNASITNLGADFLQKFCKEASVAFFSEYGLISHQIHSYNDFIRNGVRRVFESFGELTVEPGYDPSKKEEVWRYASVSFGDVKLNRPTFWGGSGKGKEYNMLPRHARLQNMTYSSRINVTVHIEVYTQQVVSSDKFKTGNEQYLYKNVLSSISEEVMIGKIPVMVKSDLCWMEAEKDVSDFDHGGYFIVKGAEKTFIAQERICMKRLWITSNPFPTVAYQSEVKRNRLIIRLAPSQVEDVKPDKVLTVYFLSTEIPIWILFFSLGVSSDKEVVNLIDYGSDDASISNILFASISTADKACDGFRRSKAALTYVDKKLKKTKFPPKESIEECVDMYVFPNLRSTQQKARFLGYMVKCLLLAATGRRKCNNKDDFRNKRLDLAGELLERELRAHVSHAWKRMSKALQRDLYGDKTLRSIEFYLDASIVTNGLSRAFSTGAWCHPFKRTERISGVVANVGRTNPLHTIVDMRKIRQQVQYTGKVGDARFPHPSHWGRICFLATTDGENCGLVKNLATTGLVSLEVVESLISKLCNSGMEKLVNDISTPLDGKDKVFLNGDWVGVCVDSLAFIRRLRIMRRKKKLPHQ